MLLLVVLAVACAGAVHVGTAQAISACGTITSNTTLTADCTAPLTVGTSGITVNLGGHSVLCSSLEDGILIPVDVSSSTVSNGSVKGGTGACEDGVVVDGSSNRLISLTETGANEYGFNITGDLNSLLAVSGNDNRFYGRVANGSFNTVRPGTFAFNADGGARFDYGTRNAITRSTTFDNRVGIAASSGATNTTVMLNTSSDNSTAGYFLGGGSTGSILFLNKASFNGVGIWISSLSNHNSVITIGSYLNGLDMQDGNANCDTNLWASNVFTTANQSCIG